MILNLGIAYVAALAAFISLLYFATRNKPVPQGYDGFLESSACTKATSAEIKRVVVGVSLLVFFVAVLYLLFA